MSSTPSAYNGVKNIKSTEIKKKVKKPRVKLVGEDGNAFSIIGRVSLALKKAGLKDQAKKFQEEATSGDYNNVLQTAMKYADVY